VTPKQLSQMLANQAEQVAISLLPTGKKNGKHWRVGSIAGEDGQSLAVHIVGEKAGRWVDYATGEHGDLIDLWAITKDIELGDAIREVKDYLGVSDPEWKKSGRKYTPAAKPKCTVPKGKLIRWLMEDMKISEGSIQSYQVACHDTDVIYPFKRTSDKGADMPMCQYRSIASDKNFPTSQNQMPCLFGWQAIPGNAREVTLCADPLDAMALHTMNYPALAVPSIENMDWLEYEYEHLERFDCIFVCMGSDKQSRTIGRNIIERLGRERCRLVNLPDKTPVDCLRNGMQPESAVKAFQSAVYLDPSELKSAREFHEEVNAAFYPEDDEEQHEVQLPWQHKRDELSFRMNELGILFGINGHGKSQLAGYLTNNAIHQGYKACVASMEIKPKMTLKNMVKQASGQKLPTLSYINAVMEWYDDTLWIFNCTGTAKSKRILEVFEYAYKRYGIKWFVIDSFMKCGIAEDDYNAQKAFVEALADFKNEFDVFIMLLVHPRKSENEASPLGKMDIKGTGAISDLVDTVLTVWRNKFKEDICAKLDAGEALGPEHADVPDSPDAICKCVKQRNHDEGKEPTIPLWFDNQNLQYHAGPTAKAFQFVAYSGEAEIHETRDSRISES